MDLAGPGKYDSGAVILAWSWTVWRRPQAVRKVTSDHRQANLQPPYKNLQVAHYTATELAGLQGEELRKKQAHLQELLSTAELQKQAMEPVGEASGSQRDHGPPAMGQNKPWAQQASLPNQGRAEHIRSNHDPGKSGGNYRTQQSSYHNRHPHDPTAVMSKPPNLPRPDAVELARGKAAAQAMPAPEAGHDVQGH
jgi:hypothetical protein